MYYPLGTVTCLGAPKLSGPLISHASVTSGSIGASWLQRAHPACLGLARLRAGGDAFSGQLVCSVAFP